MSAIRYAQVKHNDVANGEGVCVSFWTQGCPHKCKGCHNPETWDFNGGLEFNDSVIQEILEAIPENGIERSFSILGGEPLAEQNLDMVLSVISSVRDNFPNIHIYLWTGYTLEEISSNSKAVSIISKVNTLIDGRFIEEQMELGLRLRGSRNQRIIEI